jgi:hypothetical protein
MPIYSSAAGGSFDKPFQLPPAGVHSAVCVDVIDEGMKPNPYKNDDGTPKPDQHKISLVWQINRLMENGKRFSIRQWFTNSIYSGNGKKSNLRGILDSWGIVLSAEQNLGIELYDTEEVIGRPCLLNIIYEQSKDGTKTYANVGSIMPLPDGMPVLRPENYVRKAGAIQSQEEGKALAALAAHEALLNPTFDDDSDVPF